LLYEKLDEQGMPLDESLQVALILMLLGMPVAKSAKQVYWVESSLLTAQ
jgi:hypothetical protein